MRACRSATVVTPIADAIFPLDRCNLSSSAASIIEQQARMTGLVLSMLFISLTKCKARSLVLSGT
jgi:hypothetical protein